ncbi:MAG: 30S ribosomal protein S27e [Candidatus Bathyarchaeota archaeon]
MKKKRLEPIPKPGSNFIKVKCPDCGNEQIIFNKTSISVKCNICGALLAEPTGGKASIKGSVVINLA